MKVFPITSSIYQNTACIICHLTILSTSLWVSEYHLHIPSITNPHETTRDQHYGFPTIGFNCTHTHTHTHTYTHTPIRTDHGTHQSDIADESMDQTYSGKQWSLSQSRVRGSTTDLSATMSQSDECGAAIVTT